MNWTTPEWLNHLEGWLAADAYSTAWVALVPDRHDPGQPAWPEALDYLRQHQLEDGGWGAPRVYYAHERTISTLAALRALHSWGEPEDRPRIERGLRALRRYAVDLAQEPHEPVGFELLLPSLRDTLVNDFPGELPLDQWKAIDAIGREKLKLISRLSLDPDEPRAWWFSLEMLSIEQLSLLDDSLLNEHGSVETSTAATAAYLYARRLMGSDSPRAARYLDHVLKIGEGSVPFCWPAEVFETAWALDGVRRVGITPAELPLNGTVDRLARSWEMVEPGLSSSSMFRVNDGDDTVVGYAVLDWAGQPPDTDVLLRYWNGSHFLSYLDERSASVSANLHAITALRLQPGFPHKDIARQATRWVVSHMRTDGSFDDKWHLSPHYCVAHAIPAFIGWNEPLTQHCIDFLIEHQRSDGGWGWFGHSTLEETAHAVIGLANAHRHDLLPDRRALTQAARFLRDRIGEKPIEHFWIGKTVFRPDTIVAATLYAAWSFLERAGFTRVDEPPEDGRLVEVGMAAGPGDQSPGDPVPCVEPVAPTVRHLRMAQRVAYSLSFQFVLTPARRDDVLTGEVAAFVEGLVHGIAGEYGWTVIEAAARPDHLYLALETPPQYAPDAVAGLVKEITACESLMKFPHLEQRFRDGDFWEDGYLVWSSGQSLTEEDIAAYLRVKDSSQIVG
jgi:REP element-mobilizing transposase RayT